MPARLDAPSGVTAGTRLTPAPPGGPDAPAVVAFYLPQYHRVPENDAWWGEGFTDWRNVTAARPLYPGHAVPNLPGELGEYDLLSREVRAAQAELAREHGVYGFCYYFYWFGGRRLLERPLELMLEDGQPDLPFCLCWANEPWTRRWDGREQDVLMPQHHDRVRDLAILDDLMPYFEDPRYIRIDGRPLLLVYRQGLMPDAAGFAADLRAEAFDEGYRACSSATSCQSAISNAVRRASMPRSSSRPTARSAVRSSPRASAQTRPSGGTSTTTRRPCSPRSPDRRAVVPVLPGRHASLGQHGAQGHAGAHLPRVDARALRALAASSRSGSRVGATRARRSSSSTPGTSGPRVRTSSRIRALAGSTSRSYGGSSVARATSDVARLRSMRQTRTLRSEGRSSKSSCGRDGLMRPRAVPSLTVWRHSSQPTADCC